MPEYVNSFRDLIVYRRSRKLAGRIFLLTKNFPVEERFSLTDQIRRSSRSVGAQVAECWAKRRYENHFISKLTDADGEQQETQHWLEVAPDCGYVTELEAGELLAGYAEIGRLIGGMMAKAAIFCNPDARGLREDSAPYFASPDAETHPGPLNTEH